MGSTPWIDDRKSKFEILLSLPLSPLFTPAAPVGSMPQILGVLSALLQEAAADSPSHRDMTAKMAKRSRKRIQQRSSLTESCKAGDVGQAVSHAKA